MWYFFPGMWRTLFGRDRSVSLQPTWRGTRPDVYVLQHPVRDGGKLYFLFTERLPVHSLGTMVGRLSELNCVVGGSIEVEPHSVVVEWAPFYRTWQSDEYLRADIRLTVFEELLGTLEPNYRVSNIMYSDLVFDVQRLSRQCLVDWTSELGIQNA